LANTPASAKINEALLTAKNFNPEAEQGKVGSVSKDDPFKLNSAINQGIVKSAEKGFSFLAKSAIGDASKTGLKSISGSSLHNAIKEIGGFFGYKFKAWEAVKITEKIGKGAKFLGPAMAILGWVCRFMMTINSLSMQKRSFKLSGTFAKTLKNTAKPCVRAWILSSRRCMKWALICLSRISMRLCMKYAHRLRVNPIALMRCRPTG
jgi:hypothetical protein